MSAVRTFRSTHFGAPSAEPQSLGIPSAAYPGRIATNSDLIVAVDRQQTSLALPLGSSDTSMTVTNPAAVVAFGLLSIDNELVQTTGAPVGNIVPIARGFDGTLPAIHLAGAIVSGYVTAWHHNALVAEIEAIESTLGPNLSRIPSAPFLSSSAFNFPAQSPGGNLTVGANVVTLSPVPPGVNGTDANHYLYISAGTGTPEAALITGGTAVAGAPSGTVIVTCANTHSGAWTIQSATSGIQEAVVNGPSGSMIFLPAAFLNIYGPINVPCCGYTLVGQDRYGSALVRQFTGAQTMLTLNSSNIYNVNFMMGAGLMSTGSFLTVSGSNQYVGRLRFTDSSTTNCSDTLIVVDGAFMLVMDSIAIFTSTTNGIVWRNRSQGFLSNVTSTSGAPNQTVINWQDGYIDGNLWVLQGTGSNSIGIKIAPGAGGLASECTIDHVTLDSFEIGLFATAGSGSIDSIIFSNFRVGGQAFAAVFTGPNINDIILHDWSIGVTAANTAQQIRIDSGQGYSLDTVNIINGTGANGYSGIVVSSGGVATAGLSIHNCRVGYLENGTPDTAGCTNGIWIAASASDRISVTDNQLGGATPLLTQATGTHQWYADNQGVDDIPPAINSAATIDLPPAGGFVLNGGTGVGTITSKKSAGSKWSFTVGASTAFTASPTIGNTITITKCGQIYYDGAKFWITGI